MKLSAEQHKKLLPQLDRLGEAIEELLLTGLTTASEATRQTLGVTFQEASRQRLLRLSGTLRIANEELGRYTRNDENFSQQRLVFFLNRAWLLAKGIARALRENDQAELEKLLWTPPAKAAKSLNVITLGVAKKVAAGAFCAFDFRLRGVDDDRSFVWSTVFPLKQGVEIPPEGFLHIPHNQKFTANLFLEKKVVTLTNIGLIENETGPTRIQLGDKSTVETGEDFNKWEHLVSWNAAPAIERIQNHTPGPFDLDVELQEEVFLTDWRMGEIDESPNGWVSYAIQQGGVAWDGRVADGVEGKATHKQLKRFQKKKTPPPLFGVMHYESCRLVLQPLTLFTEEGPQYITISEESIDRKALLQTLKFT